MLLSALLLAAVSSESLPPETIVDQIVQSLAADDLRAFDGLGGAVNTAAAWRSVRELVERYECVSVTSYTAEIEKSATGATVTVVLDAVARTAGAPRRPTRLPREWLAELSKTNNRWRVTKVQTLEGVLASRLFATSREERLPLIAANVSLDHVELIREMCAVAVEPPRPESVPMLAEVLDLARALGDARAEAIALRFYSRMRLRAGDAAHGIEEALNAAVRTGSADLIADAEFVTAMAAWTRNDLDAAKVHLSKVVDRIGQLDDPRLALRALRMECLLEMRRRHLRAAILLARREVELSRRYAWREGELNALFGEAVPLGLLGDARAALELMRRAEVVALDVGSPRHHVFAAANSAVYLAQLGRTDEAIAAFRRLLAATPELDPETQTHLRLMLGLALVDHRGHLDEAEILLRHTESSVDPQERAHGLAGLGQIRLQQGRHEEALAFAAEAQELARSSNAPGSLDGLSPWAAHFLKAQALRGLDRLREAEAEYRAAVQAIEHTRSNLAAGGVHLPHFFTDKSGPYRQLAGLLASRGETREALRIADAYKARAVVDELRSEDAGLQRQISASDRLAKETLVAEIERLNRASMQAKNRSKQVSLARELAAARDALGRLETVLRFKYAEHFTERSARLGDPLSDPSLVPTTRQIIVEYLVGEHSSLAFVISRRDSDVAVSAHRIAAGREELLRRVDTLRRGLEQRSIEYSVPARELHDLLIAPLREELLRAKRVTIIPDDGLWRVPFHALVDRDGRSLGERIAVSYALSLSAHRIAQHRAVRATAPSILAYADPLVDSTHSRMLPRLPEAATEGRTVAAMYGTSRIRTGANAREEDFKQEASRYTVLHLAAHALMSDATPMYSAIALSASPADDGMLEAREIARMRLDADVVVLSACDTARSGNGGGEGMVGLSWAFFVAGCPTTVASQWAADSAAASRIMIEFHRALTSGIAPAAALQRAQKRLRADPRYAHPFYWAPFVIIGADQ